MYRGQLKFPFEIIYFATSSFSIYILSQATAGYSGSDICLVCKEAAMRPVRKIFAILEDHEKGTPCCSEVV